MCIKKGFQHLQRGLVFISKYEEKKGPCSRGMKAKQTKRDRPEPTAVRTGQKTPIEGNTTKVH